MTFTLVLPRPGNLIGDLGQQSLQALVLTRQMEITQQGLEGGRLVPLSDGAASATARLGVARPTDNRSLLLGKLIFERRQRTGLCGGPDLADGGLVKMPTFSWASPDYVLPDKQTVDRVAHVSQGQGAEFWRNLHGRR